jgi:hypothetical protein
LREIATQLGVAHVLEGSVQRGGNRVKVTAQLIDARTDLHLWAEVYNKPLDDVFAIQSEIAKAIADQLKAEISPSEKEAIETPPTTDPAAFSLYEQAKALWSDAQVLFTLRRTCRELSTYWIELSVAIHSSWRAGACCRGSTGRCVGLVLISARLVLD